MATIIHERQNEPTALMTITNLALQNQTFYTMAARPPQIKVAKTKQKLSLPTCSFFSASYSNRITVFINSI